MRGCKDGRPCTDVNYDPLTPLREDVKTTIPRTDVNYDPLTPLREDVAAASPAVSAIRHDRRRVG